MKRHAKIKLIALFSFLALSLTSCDTKEIGERISTTVNNMLPNLWFTLLQLALFIVTFLIIFFLAYKPLKKKLSQRAEYIESNIKDSENKKKEAEENLKKSAEYIDESKKQASKILQTAQVNAESYAQESQKALQESIEKQKVQAHKDIEAERAKTIKGAKADIIEAAILTSKELLKRDVNIEDNDKIVDEFINELTKSEEINSKDIKDE